MKIMKRKIKINFLKDRILHSGFRTRIVTFIFFWPSLEILYYLYHIKLGASIPNPDYAFFLTVNSAGIGHLFQSLWLWFMPFYLTILFGELCMEDFKTGYAVVLLSKTGKKSYVLSYIKGSFLYSFFMAFAALAFDFILVHIVFAGGAYSPYSPSEYDSSWLLFQYDHASIANIVFMFITSIVISLMAVFCTITALVIRNRKIVYGINVILWLVFVLKKNSVVLLFQPFSEYSLKTLFLIGTGFTACYLLSVIILYMLEVYRKDEISLA